MNPIQIDAATGRRYIDEADGKRYYISPAAFGEGDPAGPSFFRSRETWDPEAGTYRSGTNWGNLLSLGAGGAMAIPALAALAAGGGGAAATAAGSSVAPVASVAPIAARGLGASLLTSLLPLGIQAGTNLLGTHLQNNAVNDAAKLQTDAQLKAAAIQAATAKEALDYLKNQDAAREGRLGPYRDLGQAGLQGLGRPIGNIMTLGAGQ